MATKKSLPKPQRRRTPQFGGITLDDLYRLASLAVPFAGQPLSGGSNDWLVSPASQQGGGQNWGFSGPQGSLDQTYNPPPGGGFTAAPAGGIDRGAYAAPISAAPTVARATAPTYSRDTGYATPTPTPTPTPNIGTTVGRVAAAGAATLPTGTTVGQVAAAGIGTLPKPSVLGAAVAKIVPMLTALPKPTSTRPTLTRPVAY